MKIFFSLFFIVLFIHCSSAEINVESSRSKLDELIEKSSYKIVKTDFSKNSSSLFNKGKKLLDIEYDPLSAEQIFRFLVKKEPNNSEYLYYESKAAFFIGEFNFFNFIRDPFDLALGYIDRALKIQPKNRRYLLMRSYIIGRIGLHIRKKDDGGLGGLNELGQSTEIIKDLLGTDEVADLSEKEIEALLKKDYVGLEAVLTRAEIYKDSPSLLGGSKESAYKLLEIVKKNYPENLRARDILGVYFREKEEYNKAIKEFEFIVNQVENKSAPKKIETKQVYVLVLKHLGESYWSLEKKEKAKEYFEKHLKEREASAAGNYWLAKYYLDKKDKVKAKQFAEKAVNYNPYYKDAKELLENINAE